MLMRRYSRPVAAHRMAAFFDPGRVDEAADTGTG
jgi:hypothetical protein